MQLQTAWLGFLPVYLFLGGLGGAVLAVAAVLDAVGPKRFRRTVFPASISALASLVAGALVLLFDLGVPLRGLLLWQSFSNPRSWLSVGAWTLLAAMVLAGMLAVLSRCRVGCGRGGSCGRRWARRAVDGACLLVGLATCAYTGALLMRSTAIVSWGTWLLPVLFAVSSLSAGVPAVGMLWRWCEKRKRARRMEPWNRVELGFIAAEALVLAAFVGWLATGEATAPAAEMLFSGRWAVVFWAVVVAVGLAVPFVLASVVLWRGLHPKAIVLVSAVCVLAGNLALRFLVLAIGLRAPVLLL